jgi:hypothetical protein
MAKVIVATVECVIGGRMYKPWQIISAGEFFGMRDIDRHGRFDEIDESQIPVKEVVPAIEQIPGESSTSRLPFPLGGRMGVTQGNESEAAALADNQKPLSELAQLAAGMFTNLPQDMQAALADYVHNTGKLPKEVTALFPAQCVDDLFQKMHEFISFASEKTRIFYEDLLGKLRELQKPAEGTQKENTPPPDSL